MMTKINPLMLTLAFLLLFSWLPARVDAASINSAQTGDFNDTNTWVGGAVPTTGDAANVLNTHTVTLKQNQGMAELRINTGGTLVGGGFLVTLTTGTGNTGIYQNDGTLSGVMDLTIVSATTKSFQMGGTGFVRNFNVSVGAGNTLTNGAGAVNWYVSKLDAFSGTLSGAGRTIIVEGTTTVYNGAILGTSSNAWTFNQSGAFTVNSGGLFNAPSATGNWYSYGRINPA